MVQQKLNEDEEYENDEVGSMSEDAEANSDSLEEEEEINSLVEDMNSVAKTQSDPQALRSSPRLKRKLEAFSTSETPNKRRAVATTPAHTTDLPHNASTQRSKLRSRPSAVTRSSVNRNNLYEISDDQPRSAEKTRQKTPPQFIPKARVLKKKTQPDPSPFKGRGELDIIENGTVNLADTSPIRKSPTAAKKILPRKKRGKNRSRNPAGRPPKLRPPPPSTAEQNDNSNEQAYSRGEQSGIPNSNADAEADSEDSELPEKHSNDQLAEGTTVPQGSTETAQKLRGEATPLPRQRARVSGLTNAEDLSDRMRETNTNNGIIASEKRKVGRPQGSKTKVLPGLIPIERTKARDHEDVTLEQQQNLEKEPGTAQVQKATKQRAQRKSPQTQERRGKAKQRTETQEQDTQRQESQDIQSRPERAVRRNGRGGMEDRSERQRAKRVEYLRKLREAGHSLLDDVAPAVALYNLSEYWAELRGEAKSIIDGRARAKPSSDGGIALVKLMKQRSTLYDSLSTTEQATISEIEDKLTRNMQRLTDTLRGISAVGDVQKDMDTARDIYEHVIPKLLLTLKKLLQARFSDEKLSFKAHQDLVELLAITFETIEKGRKWRDCPIFDDNLLSRMRDVKLNIRILKNCYQRELECLQRSNSQQEARDDYTLETDSDYDEERMAAEAKLYEEQQQREAAAGRAEKAAKYERIQRKILGYPVVGQRRTATPSMPTCASQPPEDEDILDVDDIGGIDGFAPETTDLDEVASGSDNATHVNKGMNGTHVSAAAAAPPGFRREQTEEIPGPAPSKWTNEENIALCNGLQDFTGYTRFQDILRAYGEEQAALRNRDLDDIISQAKFIKRSLASRLKAELGSSFDWLRSVPD